MPAKRKLDTDGPVATLPVATLPVAKVQEEFLCPITTAAITTDPTAPVTRSESTGRDTTVSLKEELNSTEKRQGIFLLKEKRDFASLLG